jgi:DNA-directed RNA polymerase specialized sigma24 family protein
VFDENLIGGPPQAENLLALEDALVKLAELDSQQARIVELRFFGGLNVAEVAETMQMSKRSVEREWTMVRSWLRRELSDNTSP